MRYVPGRSSSPAATDVKKNPKRENIKITNRGRRMRFNMTAYNLYGDLEPNHID
jgi:hypothetical protein